MRTHRHLSLILAFLAGFLSSCGSSRDYHNCSIDAVVINPDIPSEYHSTYTYDGAGNLVHTIWTHLFEGELDFQYVEDLTYVGSELHPAHVHTVITYADEGVLDLAPGSTEDGTSEEYDNDYTYLYDSKHRLSTVSADSDSDGKADSITRYTYGTDTKVTGSFDFDADGTNDATHIYYLLPREHPIYQSVYFHSDVDSNGDGVTDLWLVPSLNDHDLIDHYDVFQDLSQPTNGSVDYTYDPKDNLVRVEQTAPLENVSVKFLTTDYSGTCYE